MSEFPITLADVHEQLIEAFPANEVGSRPAGKGASQRQVQFINARAVYNRLDAVVGPDGWETRLKQVSPGVCLCEMTVLGVTKSDMGMAGDQEGEIEKSAASDAIKRAAVQFGIGRYLYDQSTSYSAPAGNTAPPAGNTGAAPAQGGAPGNPIVWFGDAKGKSIYDPTVELKTIQWGMGKASNRDKTPDMDTRSLWEAEYNRRTGNGGTSGAPTPPPNTPTAPPPASNPTAAPSTGSFAVTPAMLKDLLQKGKAGGMGWPDVQKLSIENFNVDPSKITTQSEWDLLNTFIG